MDGFCFYSLIRNEIKWAETQKITMFHDNLPFLKKSVLFVLYISNRFSRYAGPNSNQITNGFGIRFQSYLCTKRDYIYILIDARGSGRDGWNKIFQIYKKFGTVEIEDQIEVTK